MSNRNNLLQLVQPEIEKIEAAMRSDISSLSKMDDYLLEIVEYGLFSGGKRFRPLLAVLCSRLNGGEDRTLYSLAIAFEYLHLATLFHDDVIDQAETRRGKPSVGAKFGITPAILAGDFLHARSMELVGRYGRDDSLTIFCQATAGMVEGEFLQLRNATNFNQSEADYFRAVQGKTALLISATTEIGALQGRANPEMRKALRDYGAHLGYGFQIIDDLLDYQGESDKTGKSVGNDLIEGKMTLPIIYALEEAAAVDGDALLNILSDPEQRKGSFTQVYSLIEKYGGFERTRRKAEECIAKAVNCLNQVATEKSIEAAALEGLARYVLTREK